MTGAFLLTLRGPLRKHAAPRCPGFLVSEQRTVFKNRRLRVVSMPSRNCYDGALP